MKSPDPASLQNLNDIVLPAQVNWWPLATGWYFLFALALIVLAWFGYRSIKRWSSNRYRRAALEAFHRLERDMHDDARRGDGLRQIPVLIKRTALSVYPRKQVASLAGAGWHQFLNSKTKKPLFTEPVAEILDRVSYSAGDLNEISPQAAATLLEATHHWLKNHRAASRPQGPRET
ncbi:MAG: DUF4381 domain-containing protein [Xanthomonadales bacterium]|nr:DUF4381 domain-containing protein [Xanthomonadales bacterium]